MAELSERETQLPDAMISRLIQIAVERRDIISLGAGEPDFPAPPQIVQYTKKIAGKCNHYSPPGGRHELKEALMKKLRKDNRIKANPENIVVTCGSQEAILLAAAVTLDVSEQMIIPEPSFFAYLPTLELLDVTPVHAPLAERHGWQPDMDMLKKAIDKKKTKAIIINTPGNPTGAVLGKKTLEELADVAIEYDLYVFSDEAYEKIVYEKKHFSIGSLNGMQDNIITFQSFSKTYAMCGYRLGYCVAPKKIADAMTKSHVYTAICAPTISQMLGVKALSACGNYTNMMTKEYKRRRDFIVKRLNEMGLHTRKPEGAFYAFSKVEKNSRRFALRLLKEAKVAVVPGSDFGPHGESYIRCSFATDMRLIAKAMDRMEKFVSK